MNNCSFIGRVGKDAVIREVGDTTATGWSLAVKSGYGQREQTLWIDCTLWGQRGERLAEYIVKGSQLGVTGELGTRDHDGKTYLTLKVQDVTLVGGKKESDGAQRSEGGQRGRSDGARQYAERSGGGGRQQPSAPPADDFSEDDIPFE